MTNLSEQDSPAKVVNAINRHIRLCTQNREGEKYVAVIKKHIVSLKTEIQNLLDKEEEVDYAYDRVYLYDRLINDEFRKIHNRTKDFDRDNLGKNVRTLVFSGGKLNPVVVAPILDKPQVAHAIIQKISSLGTDHPLFPLANELNSYIENCTAAIAQRKAAESVVNDAKIQLDIAKVLAIKQYSANYFAAANDYDENYAEKLFPVLRKSNKEDKKGNATDTKP